MSLTWQYVPYDSVNSLNTGGSVSHPSVYGIITTADPTPWGTPDTSQVAWILMDGNYLYYGTDERTYKININGQLSPTTTNSFEWIFGSAASYAILSNDGQHLYTIGTEPDGLIYLFKIKTSDGTKIFDAAKITAETPDPLLWAQEIIGAPFLDNQQNIHILWQRNSGIFPPRDTSLLWSKLSGVDGSIIQETITNISGDKNPNGDFILSQWPISFGNTAYAVVQNGFASKATSVLTLDNITMSSPDVTKYLDADAYGVRSFLIKDGFAYMTAGGSTTNNGLYKFDLGGNITEWFEGEPGTAGLGASPSAPCISSDDIIYYIDLNKLYAYDTDGNKQWEYSLLPSSNQNNIPPMIGSDGLIYVFTDNKDALSNIYIFENKGSYASLLEVYRIDSSSTRYINGYPILSNGNIVFYMVDTSTGAPYKNYIYVLRGSTPTTTTTTTTEQTTTTTTTKKRPPLDRVITVFVVENQDIPSLADAEPNVIVSESTTILAESAADIPPEQVSIFSIAQETNASNAEDTKSTVFSESMTFGSIAPGEKSKTIIAALNVPDASAITNIKLGLISIGNLEFANDIFGVDSNYQLTQNHSPESYFQGINTDESPTNAYNISIPNRDNQTSNYVYLNVNIPRNSIPESSILRYRWFFDYAE